MSGFTLPSDSRPSGPPLPDSGSPHTDYVLSATDRELILATQAGLPLVPDPWGELGQRLGLPADEVLARFQHMQQAGVIRRVAAVPDHYRLGYRFNGMTVWDVADDHVMELGQATGQLPFVSHC